MASLKKLFYFSLFLSVLLFFIILGMKSDFAKSSLATYFYSSFNFLTSRSTEAEEIEFEKPEIVKGIYFTSYSASSSSKINYAINLAKQGKINAVVIDIKDYSGYVFYDTNVLKVEEYKAEQIRIRDISGLIKKLHNEGIYAIARIAVFQDPVLAGARNDLAVYNKYSSSKDSGIFEYMMSAVSLWLDNKKLSWVDPASEEAWDYNISIAKDAISKGFDEVNFDYIRFPSDGKLSQMGFPKWDGITPRHTVIKNFFKKIREEMPDAVLSVDLFGLATINRDDLGIGQVIEDAYEYFDFICPMVYPSHYASGFIGFKNPASYPYEVVAYSMENANSRLEEFKTAQSASFERTPFLRPWIQDFNMGAVYDSEMVNSEIKASQDSLGNGYKGFLLWNPSNIYTQGAL